MFEAKAQRAHLSSSQKIETRIKAEALSKYKHLSPTFTFDVPHFEYILLYKKDSLIFPHTHTWVLQMEPRDNGGGGSEKDVPARQNKRGEKSLQKHETGRKKGN